MNALEVLKQEHALIRQVVDAFEAFVDASGASERIDRTELERFVRFFREYVDLLHHEKEEGALFVFATQHGANWEHGILARVRSEHEQERYLLRSLRQATCRESPWSNEDRRQWVSIARELVEFQRAHMAREAQSLFDAVRPALASSHTAELERALRGIDEQCDCALLEVLGRDLAKQHAISKAQMPTR